MNRDEMIIRILDRTEPWDILVVGELEKNEQWESKQVESFQRMGEGYLPGI